MKELRNRAVIENISPSIDSGDHQIKRLDGESLKLSADIFSDGHDIVRAVLVHKKPGSSNWTRHSLDHIVNDRWEVELKLTGIGAHKYYFEAWVDYALNWQHELIRKVAGGQHVDVELLDGIQYLGAIGKPAQKEAKFIEKCIKLFENDKEYAKAVELAQSAELKQLFEKYPYQTFPTISREFEVWVDRKRAGFSAWYEFFPRSSGDDLNRHGTFSDVEKRLDYVSEMGFDVVYFPPIHPIGEINRKGKNNATKAEGDDVGSPWAIGSKDGGHKDIHKDLGSIDDFKSLIKKGKRLGLEIAMDFAIQCAPDHPYVKEHPDWFRWRPDGSVQYAENPPKKYQDILPIYFESKDWENLWNELKSIVEYWIDQGISIFRVDNPHTKPFRFWEWLISEVHKKHPEIIFLSEAFTRPKIMHQLAKVGFTQSYTYFTWRNNKQELSEYMNELVNTESREYFRPNFWPNTPDILPYELQQLNEATYLSRFFLASTLSSNYGMYGPVYENMIHRAVPGKEEYWNSEKYEINLHQWNIDNKLKQVIKLLNAIRREHPALQETFNWVECEVENQELFAYYKGDGSGDHILCVVNLDPYYTQKGWVKTPLNKLGLSSESSYTVRDLITQSSYQWSGEWNYVELNPHGLPFHCFHILI